jgi:aminoglycoside phosphotransferase (APT) family kinase protein
MKRQGGHYHPAELSMREELWRELVDLDRLRDRMDNQVLGRGPIERPTPLAGGTQNVQLKFWRDGRPYVLRCSARHPHGDGNATNRREARVLGALVNTDVPYLGLIATCSLDEVIGASFYLMEPLDGFNATIALPALHASDASIRRPQRRQATWCQNWSLSR